MDYFKHPYLKAYNQLLSHNPKRIIKLMVSFSLFCVFFSLLPLLLQSFKPFLMQFFTYTIDKSYMFLLCNGLLVFIAMNSGLINVCSSSCNGFCQVSHSTWVVQHNIDYTSTHQSIEVAVDNKKGNRLEFEATEIAAPTAAENVMKIEYPQAEEKSLMMIVGQEDELSDTRESEEDELSDTRESEEEEGNAPRIIDDDEHAAEDTQELNKKCEEFIRKMKAAFCSETRGYYYSVDFDNQKSLVAVK